MRRILTIFLFFGLSASAQVAVNTDGSSPDASAILDVKSTTKGLLLPRMTSAERQAIASPATGLTVYDLTTQSYWYYNGTSWAILGYSPWTVNGNNIYNSNSGNVGIGTTTPGAMLEVTGDARVNELTVGRGGGNVFTNTTLGYIALSQNTAGTGNTAVGFGALFRNIAGSRATAVGNYAMYKSNDQSAPFNSDNVAIGFGALLGPTTITGVSTGVQNTAVGSESLNVISTGSSNVAVGYHAGFNNSSGFQNTSLGSNSLVNNTTGSYHTAIGYNTGPNANNLANTTTLGIDATGTATDQVRIGNVFVNSIGGYVSWSNISDGRFKENLAEDVPGLSFITQLHPVTYRLNRNAINAHIGVDAAYKGEALSGITSGFVAQEVEKAAQCIGYDFSGVDAPKNDKDVYALRYSDFVVPLVKAVQELNTANNSQRLKLEAQQRIIENQQVQITELRHLVHELMQNSK